MRQRLFDQVTTDAGGDGTITFGPVPLGTVWYVERIAIDSAGTPDVTVYTNEDLAINIEDFSDGVARNIADESSPIYCYPGEKLLVVVDGATALSVFTAKIQVNAIPEEIDRAPEAAARKRRAIVTTGLGGDGMLPAW